jgi:Flp pilus assembly protein TadB
VQYKKTICTDKSGRNFDTQIVNSPKSGLRVASVLFGILAIGHLLRLINQAQVIVGTLTIPMGLSWIALIVATILCVWFWRLASQ